MKILIEINHPAHYHFFKYSIKELVKKHHEIKIIIRDKDIIRELISDDSDFKNIYFLQKADNSLKKILSLISASKKLFKIALEFKPDLFIGWNAIYSGIVSFILRKPFILFEDNEYTWNQLLLRIPFASIILTNSSFPQKFGRKHFYYNSYEELTYLHPKYFKINNEIFRKYGINKKNKLIVVRMIAWNATHDYNQHGLFSQKKDFLRFIIKLRCFGNILLSIENNPPKLITNNGIINISSKYFHDFLALADVCITEGGTTAVEASLLGIPVIYTSTLIRSYLKELSEKYGLVFISTQQTEVLEKTEQMLFNNNIKNEAENGRKKILQEKLDLTHLIILLIENYNKLKILR